MIVIPETGFDVEPMIPHVIEVTATKKKERMTSRTIVRKFIGRPGNSQRMRIMATDPRMSQDIGISRSVRARLGGVFRPVLKSSFTLKWAVLYSKGKILTRLSSPPTASVPAPMYRT